MRRRRLFVVGALAALLAGGLTEGASAAAGPTTLGAARLTDAGPGMLSGSRYTVLVLELDLADPDGLPDELLNWESDFYPVAQGDIDHDGFVVEAPSDRLAWAIGWDRLRRVAGTPTDGTWRGSVAVSSVATGRITVDRAVVTDSTDDATSLPFTQALSVDVATTAASAPWVYQPHGSVRVVTGDETWRPSVRLTTRTGVPVVGAMTYAEGVPIQDVVRQQYEQVYPAGTPQPTRADFPFLTGADGVLTLPQAYPLSRTPGMTSVAGWNRSTSRYHTQMADGVATLVVKWQANASFAAGPGDVVTMSGNAWPAPSIYRAANPTVHLQRLVGRTWRTEASGTVRANGRYTVVWDAPDAAGYWVRAYKPGGTDANGQSAGTVGPAVWVATP